MKYILNFFIISLIIFTIGNLTACGKVSEPVPLEGSGYPHNYPQH